jgi:hypothetical protein
MPKVVIQPSYGSRVAREHFRDTMEQLVPFAEPRYTRALSRSQLADLSRMHPAGRARFWATTRAQDGNMQRLSTGDVTLFTGMNAVRAIGEIGVTLQNADFADLLWDPDPGNGSWHNVYSLRSLLLLPSVGLASHAICPAGKRPRG